MAGTDKNADKFVGYDSLEELMNCIQSYVTSIIKSPTITEEVNTDTEYKLKIMNPDGSTFITPNLRGGG